MNTGLSLQLIVLIIILLASSSEGFFLDPKKALMDFLQSLKDKKEAKKKPQNTNIKHYHVHYYPAHIHVISGLSAKAPDRFELDRIHSDHITSLGWSDYEYKYTPEPRVSISSSLQDFWGDIPSPFSWGPSLIETDVSETIDRSEDRGILVRLPLNERVIIEEPPSSQNLKTSLLAAFFQKIGGTK